MVADCLPPMRLRVWVCRGEEAHEIYLAVTSAHCEPTKHKVSPDFCSMTAPQRRTSRFSGLLMSASTETCRMGLVNGLPQRRRYEHFPQH